MKVVLQLNISRANHKFKITNNLTLQFAFRPRVGGSTRGPFQTARHSCFHELGADNPGGCNDALSTCHAYMAGDGSISLSFDKPSKKLERMSGMEEESLGESVYYMILIETNVLLEAIWGKCNTLFLLCKKFQLIKK